MVVLIGVGEQIASDNAAALFDQVRPVTTRPNQPFANNEMSRANPARTRV